MKRLLGIFFLAVCCCFPSSFLAAMALPVDQSVYSAFKSLQHKDEAKPANQKEEARAADRQEPPTSSAKDDETTGVMSELGLTDVADSSRRERPAQPAFAVPDTTMPMGWIPARTRQLVNDYTGILSSEQRRTLEQRLLACEDSSGVQVAVLLVPDLGGDEISNFAQRVWDSWGIGDSELNNGVLLIVKPKNSSSGQVRIQTGYGMEGALPDAFCKHIIDDNMIPNFEENDYYAAIDEALDVIIPVCQGEYSYKQYQKEGNRDAFIALAIFVIIIVVLLLFARRENRRGGGHGGPGSTSGRHIYGGAPFVGGFGGGSSSGGFSGGGFGGFGGGSSGGGGASGSW